MLAVRSLSKHVGTPPARRTLLDQVSFDVAPGEIFAITGESGSGKSTLLNIVAGLDTADAGSIEVDGLALAAMDDRARSLFRRHRVGFVFQAFHLLPHLTVADNVALPLVIAGCPDAQRREQVAAALADIGLADRGRARPRELSGGEMQRVALARALINRPALILADEPTGNLDADNAARVLDLLRERVQRANAACLLVTHSPAAARTAHRMSVLADGRLRLEQPDPQ